MPRSNRMTWVAAATASLLVCVFFIQGRLSLEQKSPTFDEVSFFGVGQYLLERRSFDIPTAGTHPPLFFYLSSLPQLGQPLDPALWSYSAEARATPDFILASDYKRGQTLLTRDTPGIAGFIQSRTALLSLCFLLGPLIFLWSWRLFGPWGALVSVLLFAFDPNLLAHARLITSDFTFTVMIFAAAFFASAASSSNKMKYWVAAGAFTGLSLLSKHTALVMVPLLVFPHLLRRPRALERTWQPIAIAAGIAAAVFLIGIQLDPEHYVRSLLLQLDHASSGHSAFLLGERSDRGWWYYHFVTLALKTPLPLLVLLGAIAVAGAMRMLPRAPLFELALPPLGLLVLFTLTHEPNIGLRYLLPVYPFALVLAGGAAPIAGSSRVRRGVLVVLLGWYVAGSVRAYPDYLAYFNESIGSPDNAYRYLVDSNLDWGQDLPALAHYMEQQGIETVQLSYFGAALPEWYGISYTPVVGYLLGDTLAPPLQWRGTFAISATNLVGLYLSGDYFARLRSREPDAVIGHSIFVYDLE